MKKPKCKLTGQDGNVFNLIAIATKVLKKHGMKEQAKELTSRAFNCGSYGEALSIIGEYVEVS